MNINDVFPSNYLKASDLKGQAKKVTIEDVALEEFGQDGQKAIVHFKGIPRGLVLNKTNGMLLAANLGPDTDGWIGKDIELYPTKVQFQGRVVDAIRVRLPVPPATAQSVEDADIHEDIPW